MPTFKAKDGKTVEADSFDDVVAFGIGIGAHCTHGMPHSFSYAGFPVTHESGEAYLIETPAETLRFTRGDMLVITKGKPSIVPADSLTEA